MVYQKMPLAVIFNEVIVILRAPEKPLFRTGGNSKNPGETREFCQKAR